MTQDTDIKELITAATAFLDRIDRITTDDFAHGGERSEREALREVLARFTSTDDTDAAIVVVKPVLDCRYCHGTGEVTDYVPYGTGDIPMLSFCDCVTAQVPDDAEIELDLSALSAR